ncbi:MAG: long-chain-fatty-acid--CoA ligase [Myxococcota bacterium]
MRADITRFLTDWATRAPHRPALRFAGQTTTFAQLEDRVSQLAGALTAAGLEPRTEQRVFVLDRNHPATLELTLAAARSGTTCVVGNFRLSAEETEWTVNDSQARLLFVGHELEPMIDSIRARLTTVERVIVIGGPRDGYEAFLAGGQRAAPVPHEEGDCFLQLYTSGTTGFPRGAMLTHRSVAAHTRVMMEQFSFDEASVSLVPMPLFHVGGICWALISLHAGAVSVVTRDPSPPAMLRDFVEEKVTHTFIVPAVLQGLLAVPDFARFDLSRLTTVAYGASPIPLPLLERCLAAMRCEFLQVYGMTEMSGVFCILDGAAHRDSAHRERLASAGRITPGTECKVVDPLSGQEVARGAQGEFWVRGEQRMLGYWRRDEDTRAVLRPDGWLRTGDLGRIDADGFVFLQDRLKDMVITGGENVYPAEVERVLHQLPQVNEVAVFGVPDEKWGETLRAAISLKPGTALTADAVIAFAREHLAHYKCPTQVEFVAALPRNATGKVLKRELRAPFWVGRTRAV